MRKDVELAKSKMALTFGAKREIKNLPEHLSDSETVEMMCAGTYGPGQGLMVLTTDRLIFLKDGFTKKILEDFPISKITSVQWVSGMVLGQVTIYSAGSKTLFEQVDKSDGKAITARLREMLSPAAGDEGTKETAPADNAQSGIADELKKLADLRDSGILSDDEFVAQKARLLGK